MKKFNSISAALIAKCLLTCLLITLTAKHVHSQTSNLGLNFDAIDDRATINDNAVYDLGTGNFTIEAWIKANSSQSYTFPTILSNRETGNVNSGLLVYLVTGQIALQMDGINLARAGNDLRDNICHHIAISRTGTTVTYYIDGLLVSTLTGFGQNINAAHAFWIGHDDPAPTTTRFKGLIHEVRYWNLARTLSQIQSGMNLYLAGNEAGLIGYWRMNDNSGQFFNDYTSQNNDGYLGITVNAESSDPVYITACHCTPPPATITPGGPTTFCTGGSVTLNANTGTGYTYQWRKNGIVISGATSQSYSATTTGSYTVVVTSGGCSGVSAAVVVTVNTAPSASITAGGPTSFCPGGNVVLSANSGTGLTYQWKLNGANIIGATSISYTTTQSGNYTCLVSNSCGGTTSNTITVSNNTGLPATITPGGPTSFCTGNSVTLTANSGAGYTYQWKKNGVVISGATSQSYVASQTGSYTVTITSPNCTGTSSAIAVTENPPLSPTITSSGFGGFCPSTTVGLETQVGSGTYQWFEDTYLIPNTNSYQLQTGHNGNYSVSITNSCGTYAAAPYTVTDFDPFFLQPYITIANTGSLSICTVGGSVYMAVDNGIFYFQPSFQWYKDGVAIGGAVNNDYTATTAGDYVCSVTDYIWWCGQGPIVFSNWLTVTSSSGTQPTISISAAGPVSFCTPGSVTLNSTVNTAVSYQWKKNNANISGATGASYSATTTGAYTCYVNNSCGSATSNYISVTVNSLPTAVISSNTTVICPGNTITMLASVATGNSYQWKLNGNNISGATTSNYTTSIAGSYTCVITNSCGSSTSNTITLTNGTSPSASIIPQGPTTFCNGGNVLLSANTGAGFTYQWKKNGSNISGAVSANYTATTSGSYTVVVTSGGCSSSSPAVTVTVQSIPTASITPSGSTTFCSGGSVVLNANAGTGLSYQWKKNGANISGATLLSYTATTAGSYTVTVTNSCGSSTSSPVTVTVNSNPSANVTANGPTTFCSGGSVTLSVNTSSGATYQWYKYSNPISGATSSSYVATASANYKVVKTNAAGCSKTSAITTVTVNPKPAATFTANGPTTFCAGNSVTFTANAGTGYTYQWRKDNVPISGATNISYTATTAGSYNVKVTNSFGCYKYSSVQTVTVPCREAQDANESVFDVKAYPNPSSGDFIFEIKNTTDEKISIIVYDIIGKLVFKEENFNSQFTIRNSQLNAGVYSAEIINGENKKVLKLIKTSEK